MGRAPCRSCTCCSVALQDFDSALVAALPCLPPPLQLGLDPYPQPLQPMIWHTDKSGRADIASNAAAQHFHFSRYSRSSSSTTSPISRPSSTALADARRLRAVGMRTLSWERSCFMRPLPLGKLARSSVDGLREDRRLLGWVRFCPSPLPSFAASLLVPSPRACVV